MIRDRFYFVYLRRKGKKMGQSQNDGRSFGWVFYKPDVDPFASGMGHFYGKYVLIARKPKKYENVYNTRPFSLKVMGRGVFKIDIRTLDE